MNFDHVEAGFETIGAIVRAFDCYKLYKAKAYAGIHPASTIFFFTWGTWNTVFFGGLHQPWSLVGSILLCSMNALWLILAYSYRRNNYG